MRYIKILLAILLAAFYSFYVAAPAAAFTLRNGAAATVTGGETVDGNLVISGQSVTVDGNVKGDVICAGQMVTITGAVEGDVICAAQTIKVKGNVGGSVRAAAQTIDISGKVGRNVTVAGQLVTSESEISQEMFFASQSAVIGGKVAKDVAGAASSITVSGNIGGNAQFSDQDLSLKDGAVIGGSLSYVSANDAVVASGSKIAGGARRYEPSSDDRLPVINEKKSAAEIILGAVLKLILYLFFVLIFLAMFRGPLTRAADTMLVRFGRTLGIGFLFLLLTPIVVILMMMTIIGIPVALVTILFFMTGMFLAMILVAVATGRKLTQLYFKGQNDSPVAQAVIGTVALWVLFVIPVLGGIAMFIACAWGLGGVYRMFRPAANSNPAAG